MSKSSDSSFDFGLYPEDLLQSVSRDSNPSEWSPQNYPRISTERFSINITNPANVNASDASGDSVYSDASNGLSIIYSGEENIYVNGNIGAADIDINNRSIHFRGENNHDSDRTVYENERNMNAQDKNPSGNDTNNNSGDGTILTDDSNSHDACRRFYDRNIDVSDSNDHRLNRNIGEIFLSDRNRLDGDINILNANKIGLVADRESFGCNEVTFSNYLGFSRYSALSSTESFTQTSESFSQSSASLTQSSDSASYMSDSSASSGQCTLSSEDRSVMHRLRCVWPECGRIQPLSYCRRSLHVLCAEHTAACGLSEDRHAASHFCVRCGSRMTRFSQERLRVVRQFIRLLRHVNAVDERGNVTNSVTEED